MLKKLLTYSILGWLPTVALAQEASQVIPLWANGAPGFEARRNEPERAQDYWVRNIHNPSVSVFLPPKDKATGAAVLICPGGGHRELVFNAEGVEAAQFLNRIGVAAFVLKYRLAREEGSPYSLPQHPREDGLRAMRLVRSRAAEWNVDPHRIGIMGFSAGGEVASLVTFAVTEGNAPAAEALDRLDCRPDFQIMIYPGPQGIPETIPSNAPPAFFLAAADDQQPARTIAALIPKYRAARVPAEFHLFAHGGHGFNMGNRSRLMTLKGWPQRLADWMADNNILDPAVPAAVSAPAKKVVRIKAGSTAPFTDASGNTWLPDQGFTDGETYARPTELAIANTPDPAIYRSERYGMSAFSYPLPNGKYTVRLHFAETFEEITAAGGRVFSFNVEGREFKDFDVFGKAGGALRAYVEIITVEVSDGKLDIKFTSGVQNPEINGVEIIPGS